MSRSPQPDFSKVRALILDSDGVLTDGGVYITASGEQSRRFDIKDGLGLVRLREHGFHLAIISASPIPVVEHRARQLGINDVYVDEKRKLERAQELVEKWGLSIEAVAYIGDDLADLQMLAAVGLPIAVSDATDSAIEAAAYVTKKPGGFGAVREVCDLILQAHGHTASVNPSAS